MPSPDAVLDIARRVLKIEAAAIDAMATRLDATFPQVVDLLVGCRGRVVLTGLGMTCVVDPDERLVGLVTDGDLRRAFMRDGAGLQCTAAGVMTRSPITIGGDLRLSEARSLMETHRITSVPVVDDTGRVTGVVHIHDLWTSGR